jgi:hypothetical protein
MVGRRGSGASRGGDFVIGRGVFWSLGVSGLGAYWRLVDFLYGVEDLDMHVGGCGLVTCVPRPLFEKVKIGSV